MLEKNNKMISEITELVNKVKSELANEINKSVVFVYWTIGKIIVSNESEYNNRLEYGKEILKGLSDELTKYLGKGYSVSNLKYMRMFYKAYPNFDIISSNLSWSHYLELMIIEDKDKRNFYEKECINSNWSVRELRRQLDTSLFERLLLSDGKPIGIILCAEKDKVMLEYALGGLSNNIFASTYTYYIPNKEQLINEVEKVLNNEN